MQLNSILNSVIFIIDNIVLRIPVLYGDVEYLEESAITVLFKNLKDVQGTNKLKHQEQNFKMLLRHLICIPELMSSIRF